MPNLMKYNTVIGMSKSNPSYLVRQKSASIAKEIMMCLVLLLKNKASVLVPNKMKSDSVRPNVEF
jgi:hypothetical protein